MTSTSYGSASPFIYHDYFSRLRYSHANFHGPLHNPVIATLYQVWHYNFIIYHSYLFSKKHFAGFLCCLQIMLTYLTLCNTRHFLMRTDQNYLLQNIIIFVTGLLAFDLEKFWLAGNRYKNQRFSMNMYSQSAGIAKFTSCNFLITKSHAFTISVN